MRRFLDKFYDVCGALAAICIISIAISILAELSGRMAGIMIPAATEFAGYCLASAMFLGLAHTLAHGQHIRVSIFLQRVPRSLRKKLDIFCLFCGSALSIYFCWHFCAFTFDSYIFGDVGHGLIKTPLWIPQCGIALGLIAISIAFIDELITILAGRMPQHLKMEA
jgi:TRAP-type C4-dicarboxylate transport system permease small subunit